MRERPRTKRSVRCATEQMARAKPPLVKRIRFGILVPNLIRFTNGGKANKIRDLGSADVQKLSDEDLALLIGKGKGKMPSYGKSLKPEQIKDLVAYIRTLKK